MLRWIEDKLFPMPQWKFNNLAAFVYATLLAGLFALFAWSIGNMHFVEGLLAGLLWARTYISCGGCDHA